MPAQTRRARRPRLPAVREVARPHFDRHARRDEARGRGVRPGARRQGDRGVEEEPRPGQLPTSNSTPRRWFSAGMEADQSALSGSTSTPFLRAALLGSCAVGRRELTSTAISHHTPATNRSPSASEGRSRRRPRRDAGQSYSLNWLPLSTIQCQPVCATMRRQDDRAHPLGDDVAEQQRRAAGTSSATTRN